MKTLSESLEHKRKVRAELEQKRIKTEHRMVLESVKANFKIRDFNALHPDNKSDIRKFILEMWNPKKGLTKRGRQYIYESKIVLAKNSTDTEIKKFIENKVGESINDYLHSFRNNTLARYVDDLCKEIKEGTGKEYSRENILDIVIGLLNPIVKEEILKN